MKISIQFFAAIFFLFCLSVQAQNINSYKIVYEADENGNSLSGSLNTLIEYVQNGNPVRVGWVLMFTHPKTQEPIEMQHWVDAGFITTLKGHVFAQIQGIFSQGPAVGDPPGVMLASAKPDSWVAVIGTTGEMRQKFDSTMMLQFLKESGMSDEEANQAIAAQETEKVKTKWAVSIQ